MGMSYSHDNGELPDNEWNGVPSPTSVTLSYVPARTECMGSSAKTSQVAMILCGASLSMPKYRQKGTNMNVAMEAASLLCEVGRLTKEKRACPARVFQNPRVFEITLLAADGSRVSAVGVCHPNITSMWASDHPAFLTLKVRPDTEVCHWAGQDLLVWVPAKH